MLEAAWFFAAIELNGALASAGAQAAIHNGQCLIEAAAVRPALTRDLTHTAIQDGWFTTSAKHCEHDMAASLLRVTLPQQALAQRPLVLSESAGLLNVALLHNPAALAGHSAYAAQASTRTIPAAAFDIFLGSGLAGLGATLTRGPLSFQALSQRYQKSAALDRITADYLLPSGAHLRAGDLRAEVGVNQQLGEYRGVLATNRAAPLRGEGKAEALLALESPARVQFFDRNGLPVYSSEILAPGNYQVQGYGASTVPGFLEARLVDIQGAVRSVTLAWSADRRLLSQDQNEWEVLLAQPRLPDSRLDSAWVAAARFRSGLSATLTGAVHAQTSDQEKRVAVEASTRQFPNWIATAAAGQFCRQDNCQAEWLIEARYALSRQANLLATLSHQAALLSVSGAFHPRLSASLSYSISESSAGKQHVAALSGSYRLHPQMSLQLQARHHVSDHTAAQPTDRGWSAFLGLSVYFASLRTAVTSTAGHRSASQFAKSANSFQVQASHNPVALYGPQVQVAHQFEDNPQSTGYFRYASPLGDASVRVSQANQSTTSWSASSRIWITAEGMTVSPTGEDNLVIQKLGQAGIRVAHQGRDQQTSDQEGRAIFRKAPAWTDSTYTVDAKSIPFGMNLASARVRIPLAMHRAYVVDYRSLWSQARSWQVIDLDATGLTPPYTVTDQTGRAVFMGEDGFVDLQSNAALPITIHDSQGKRVNCQERAPHNEDRPITGHTEITCTAPTVL